MSRRATEAKSIPAQKRARRSARMATIAGLVGEIEADAVLDAQHEGFRMAQSAVLKMQEGRSESEQRLIIEIYQQLEAERREITAKIRARLTETMGISCPSD